MQLCENVTESWCSADTKVGIAVTDISTLLAVCFTADAAGSGHDSEHSGRHRIDTAHPGTVAAMGMSLASATCNVTWATGAGGNAAAAGIPRLIRWANAQDLSQLGAAATLLAGGSCSKLTQLLRAVQLQAPADCCVG